MKILFWSEKFWPLIGGAEMFGINLISELRDRGHDVIVVTSTDDLNELPAEDIYKNIPIYRFPFQTTLSGKEIVQFIACKRGIAQLKRGYKPDLIHLNGVSASSLFHLQTENGQTTPVIVRMNQEIHSHEGAGTNTLMYKVLKNASWVTSVSQEVHNQVCKWIPDIRSRSSVIYTGVQQPTQSPSPLPFHPPVLVCLGRLVHAKGFDLAVTALASLRQRFPNIRMVIAGDGPERQQLERQVGELDLEKIVEFKGWVEASKVFKLLNSASLVLIPSRHEGLPQVAIQAAMMARPIVSTRVSGLPEVIQHQETGLLIEKEDIHGLTESISFLLQHHDASTQMGQAARTRAMEIFDWEKCVANYERLYTKLAQEVSVGGSHVVYP
jgi:glycogen(starch) synthase